jgi:hypothetical protein
MPVDDEINLNKPLTDAQINKLEKDADRMEKAAEKAQEASRKANEAIKNNPMGGSLPAKGRTEGYDASGIGSSVAGSEEAMEALQLFGGTEGDGRSSVERMKGYRRTGQSRSQSPVGKMDDEILQRLGEIELAKKEQAEAINEIQMHQREQKMHEQQMIGGVGKGFSTAQEAVGASRDPMGWAKGKAMKMLGKAGVYGAIAAMVIQMGQQLITQIHDEIKDMFRAGGVLDVRKQVMNQMKQVVELESLIDMQQGRLFFTSSNGEIMRQGVPQMSNTDTMVNGYKQYLQEYDR